MANPESYIDIDTSNISGSSVLITGSTSGLGRELALSLDRLGADIYIHGRNVERGEGTVSKMNVEADLDSLFYRADFSDFEQVRELGTWVSEEAEEIDYLVNNAGGYYKSKEKTEDGYEMNFAVNYASHFLLTVMLIKQGTIADDGRIVNVTSEAHRNTDEISFDIFKNGRSDWNSYCTSKACQIIFTRELSDKLSDSGITSCCVHPGSIPSTRISRSYSDVVSRLTKIPEYVPLPGVRNTSQGASTLLHAILVGQETGDGEYYVNFEPSEASEVVYENELSRELWKFTENCVDESWELDSNN